MSDIPDIDTYCILLYLVHPLPIRTHVLVERRQHSRAPLSGTTPTPRAEATSWLRPRMCAPVTFAASRASTSATETSFEGPLTRHGRERGAEAVRRQRSWSRSEAEIEAKSKEIQHCGRCCIDTLNIPPTSQSQDYAVCVPARASTDGQVQAGTRMGGREGQCLAQSS